MQAAYNEDWLLSKVVQFIREKGKYPTVPEFDLKSYDAPDFPSYNTIRQRLGTQSQQVARVISYCESSPEYSDVIELCRAVPLCEKTEPSDKGSEALKYGYVYLMKSGHFFKIGCSGNVERRNYDIGIKLPEPVEVLHKIATDDPTGIEAYWHDRYKEKRRQGEWFDLSKEDVSAFKRRKFM